MDFSQCEEAPKPLFTDFIWNGEAQTRFFYGFDLIFILKSQKFWELRVIPAGFGGNFALGAASLALQREMSGNKGCSDGNAGERDQMIRVPGKENPSRKLFQHQLFRKKQLLE